MDNLFSIGEVSKYQNISKQTLIFYDKIGLFTPAYVDPHNGYRYYSAKQLDYLDTILIMKKIGFSLKEIREYMQNYNLDTSLVILRKQLTVIEQQIEEWRMLQSRLLKRCDQIEKAKIYKEKEVSAMTEHVSSQYILYHAVEKPYSLQETSIATKKCFVDALQKKLPIFFQSGVIVPLDHIRQGDFTKATSAFLSIEKTDKVSNITELPAGTCASIYHIGDYLSIGYSYKKLLDYCDENSLQIISDSYEFCINDYITTYDEDEYITKIMFYIDTPKEN